MFAAHFCQKLKNREKTKNKQIKNDAQNNKERTVQVQLEVALRETWYVYFGVKRF